MKYCSVWLLLTALLVGFAFVFNVETRPVLEEPALMGRDQIGTNSPCLSDDAISTNLRLISSAQHVSQQQTAQRQLIDHANKSSECRERIIKAVMSAMNKPVTDLSQDRASFYLWHYGSEILASLRAEEALDLLIEHLELHDGTLFPLNHHPALVNVIRMGDIALPKLEAVLQHSNDPNLRHYSVFCITSIGGLVARRILMEALPTESNACVRSFITASLDALDSSTLQIAPDRRAKWYAAFLCDTP